MVLYKYNNYNSNNGVTQNYDYVSTEIFMNNYEKYNYNSFIFGSSRSRAFQASSWQKQLSPTDIPFNFDASGESVYGIYMKVKYLDSIHVNIDNALIILCRDASFEHTEDHEGHLFMKHPVLTGKNKLDFHFEFFKTYIAPKFFLSYHDYRLTKKFKPYMNGYLDENPTIRDTITNEWHFIIQENEILNDPKKYYIEKTNLFYLREFEKTDTIQRIDSKQVYFLKEIKRILEKQNTNYKIVLSPLYEQIKFNSKDIEILKNIFPNHVYDFSGKNSFTDDKINYYETSHYRTIIGDSILMRIY
jgi:hypothetical protein